MTGNPVVRLYDALSRGDVEAARACFAPHALLWHNFDRVAQDLDTAAQGWQGMIAHTKSRFAEDIRSQPTTDGSVTQFVFGVQTLNGERKAWALCVLVKINDGLITRLDEYIDRAGSFEQADGPVTTPGF